MRSGEPVSSRRLEQVFRQICRYGLVGVATNLAAYVIYLLLTCFGLGPKFAMTVLYVAGATMGFYANRKVTFKYQGRTGAAMGRYLLVQGCGYVLNLLLLLVFVDWLGFPHELVQAAAIFVVAGFLFVLYRIFVFPTTVASSEPTRS